MTEQPLPPYTGDTPTRGLCPWLCQPELDNWDDDLDDDTTRRFWAALAALHPNHQPDDSEQP